MTERAHVGNYFCDTYMYVPPNNGQMNVSLTFNERRSFNFTITEHTLCLARKIFWMSSNVLKRSKSVVEICK